MTFQNILIVDDDDASCRRLEALCKPAYTVEVARSAAEARKALSRQSYDLLILEVCLPDGDGREIVKSLVAAQPVPPVVVMTSAAGDPDTAIECLQSGAFDYLPKPVIEEKLAFTIRQAEPYARMLRLNHRFLRQHALLAGVLLGESVAAKTLQAAVTRFAASNTPLQIFGEAGVGKSALAAAIHCRGEGAAEPFLKVNCAVGSEDQLERELFGTEKEPGVLELAEGGTVVLEAIHEMPLSVQEKLLPALQKKVIVRAAKPRPISARLIVTSTEELSSLAANGQFLSDLACEFAGAALKVPPLRERLADLPRLVQHWFDTEGGRFGCGGAQLAPEAMEKLKGVLWRGNLAELWNALERVALTAERGRKIPPEAFSFLVPPSFIPGSMVGMAEEEGPLLTLEEMERRHVLRALAYTNQNRTRAAGLLKISVRTLRNKLHLYRFQGIDVGDCRQSDLPMIAPSASSSRPKPGE